MKIKSKKWRRARKFNRHHIINRCKGGNNSQQNILKFDIERHKAWHFLFGNMDFIQVAKLLTRTYQAKQGAAKGA